MKYDLARTGMKNELKNGKICMHWNVPPDALPGSATLVLFWTAGITTVKGNLHSGLTSVG